MPLLPGFIVMAIGFYIREPEKIIKFITFLVTPAIIVFGSVYWFHKYWVAKKYQPKIDRINSLITELESNQ